MTTSNVDRSTDKQPRFSVLIPLYNKAAHIGDALRSIQAQNYDDLEIIVVDDGSSDDGPEKVRSLATSDSRIRLIEQENAGVSAARNTAISAATADYLLFLDADDLWKPGLIQEIEALIHLFPECGAYSTAYSHYYENSGTERPIHPRFPASTKNHSQFSYDFFEVASRGELPITPSSCCIPKSVFEEIGAFPLHEPMGEDQDLWVRIAYKYPMAFSRSYKALYRQDADNRACISNPPDQECPFSLRLRATAEASNDPRSKAMLRLTANHILHIAQLNIQAGEYDKARALLRDKRCWLLPKRKLKWELALLLKR